jgi:hypothetical protein
MTSVKRARQLAARESQPVQGVAAVAVVLLLLLLL